ncbi:AEC family transporter [Sporosarcina pasteurii]|uniref:Auxin efflux carrier n=1 Tax=Sporosarcina pasteurii TaxID=1474 RepID=A0A380BEH4_SPOPA|nr:AEC family transporter [Sporosarcina pasteurii]MDS9472470.1 AEC family transporter [Sporosarcina pasteurii]QBQ06026.1 AEC family transporter [Sporosarcina pasteurii]SUI99653.1 auxin efflux carrier [Sporosarcina pasteurii]
MLELGIILKDILLPIFVIMLIGYWMQKKFLLNVQTLARLNIYFLVPAFIFVKLYSTKISVNLFGQVFLFFILYVVILYIISHFIGKMIRLEKGEKTTFSNSVMFFNSGNYGVPVNDLVFRSDPFAMSIQVIILTLQNIFLFSYGIFSLQSVRVGKLQAALGYFKMPVLYAMLAGVSLNYFDVAIPSFIWVPANYVADAMIALALFTLGAQVAQIKFTSALSTLYYSLTIRLAIGPLIALAIIYIFQVEGIVAQALLIGSAMPTSVNSAVIAQEYDNHPDLAAQIVLFSTLISAVTVSIVIFMARLLF